MIEAVFFDAGFTLLFPTRPIADIYVEAARSVSSGHCDTKLREAFQTAWAAGTRDEHDDHRSSDFIERERWRRFTLKVANAVPELLAHHPAWFNQLIGTFDSARGWRLAPDARKLLCDLRSRGLRLGIVSNWHAGLHRIISEVGLRELVDFVVCSADVGFRKPHPEIFNEALRVCGTKASSVIHVGDSLAEDIAGALAVGIAPVHLTNGSCKTSGPDHSTIADLAELHRLL